ncbi:hypothetical protein AAD018_012040 [Aestuariibius insulae]|uniref:hypothetical protein n=1 Tax=Aestuariibius insulae TaxID=2058287 RepID=UPI00345E4FB8
MTMAPDRYARMIGNMALVTVTAPKKLVSVGSRKTPSDVSSTAPTMPYLHY